MLPAAAYLEIARAAVWDACGAEPQDLGAQTAMCVHNVVWSRPLIVGDEPVAVHVELDEEGDEIRFAIYSEPPGGPVTEQPVERVIHCEGHVRWQEVEQGTVDVEDLRAALPADMFNLWKPLVPHGMVGTWAPVKEAGRIAWYFNGNFPWLGMAICAPVIGLWYWCTDQYIVQRALGAPNETIARRGSIFASFLKLFPPYLFIIPGLICFAIAKSGKVPELAVSVSV